jgi:hypothetical protein
MVIDGNDHRGIDVGILTKADHAITRPLLETNLKDITAHPALTADPKRPGTYGNGTASGKIDYVLLSGRHSSSSRAVPYSAEVYGAARTERSGTTIRP